MREILDSLLKSMQQQENTVLVTIVAQTGSTPRGCGAQMLVGNSGRLAGTVGGGAIEAKAISLAGELLPQQKSCREHFSLEGNRGDLGMVCGGGVELMFCFIPWSDPAWAGAAKEALRCLEESQPGSLVLQVGSPPQIESGDSGMPYGGGPRDSAFVLPLPLKQRVIVCGGGHVAQQVVPVLANTDFQVIVLENRPEFADPKQFPGAHQVVLCDYDRIADSIALQPTDFFVIMTHGHTFDYQLQAQLLQGNYAYIGVMGSRRKIASVNQRLLEAGISPESIATVHTPIGLDIGAVTPAEIAISVAAECIAVRAALRKSNHSGCPSNL